MVTNPVAMVTNFVAMVTNFVAMVTNPVAMVTNFVAMVTNFVAMVLGISFCTQYVIGIMYFGVSQVDWGFSGRPRLHPVPMPSSSY